MGPAEELRYLILAAQREGNRDLARGLRPLGLTPAQAEVLMVLEAVAPLSVRGLGERLVCEAGSPSRLVAGLVEAGLVASRPSAGDGRAAELSLTAAGRAATDGVRRVEAGLHAAIAGAGTERELGAAVGLIRRLVADRPAGRALELRRRADEGSAGTTAR
ncbi:MAG: MarR family winged helix-turn-helix transcriptional regulator [Candidatus Limnocylindrales bacterium]